MLIFYLSLKTNSSQRPEEKEMIQRKKRASQALKGSHLSLGEDNVMPSFSLLKTDSDAVETKFPNTADVLSAKTLMTVDFE